MQMELIRREALAVMGGHINRILVVGGGVKNRFWLQTKAHVFGCPLTVLSVQEAALVGAALFAGVGSGHLRLADLQAASAALASEEIVPDEHLHKAYSWLLEEGYIKLQQPLREYYGKMARRDLREL